MTLTQSAKRNAKSHLKLRLRVLARYLRPMPTQCSSLSAACLDRTYGAIYSRLCKKARSDARIILEGVTNSTTQQRTQESIYVVWQKTQDQGSVTQTLTLPSFSGPTTPRLNAPGGISVQLPDGDFKSQINTLSQ